MGIIKNDKNSYIILNRIILIRIIDEKGLSQPDVVLGKSLGLV